MDSGSSGIAVERSRNIVYSKLLMSKSDPNEFTQQLLVARYGLPLRNPDESSPSAEIGVFKSNHNHKKLFQPPMFVIPLKGARMVEDSSCMEDTKSTKDLKKLNKHSFQFGLQAANGSVYKFRVRDEREHRTWTNLIKFLAMFPHSVVPEIPNYDPPAEVNTADSTLHNKDSVWPVFVMPEEVGLRCRLEGPKILVLESQSGINKLEIYSEQDNAFPLFSCKHSEIRRIGKMGIFLYVEVGRRCKAGPGLLWLFFGSSNEKAVFMREELCKFLLNKELAPQHPITQSPRMKRSSTAPMLAEAPVSPPPLPPNRISSPRHNPSPTLPTSPLLQSAQSTSFCSSSRKSTRSDPPMVADQQAQQKFLCNSYHTLEPHRDLNTDTSEPLEDTDQAIPGHNQESLHETHRTPQYHILEPLSSPSPGSPTSPPAGQASLYHVLEHPNERKPATYHVLEPQNKSPAHAPESPRKTPPSPYFVTDLQKKTEELSPQWSVGSPLHRSPSRTPEVPTERNPYHVLEAPPPEKHGSYHVLESPPKGRRHFSQKSRMHKLNTSRSQDSYHELEPQASKDDPQYHLYQEIEAVARPKRGVSQSVIMRTDRNRSTSLVQMHQPQHKYNVLEPNETKSPPIQLQHQYDAINIRIPRRYSDENHNQHYNMLGLEEPRPTINSSIPPIYHTIANN